MKRCVRVDLEQMGNRAIDYERQDVSVFGRRGGYNGGYNGSCPTRLNGLPGQSDSTAAQRYHTIAKSGSGNQFQFVEPFQESIAFHETPDRHARRVPAPRIVNDHHRAKLRGLYNCLNLSPVPRALPSSFRQEEIDGALIVVVATLEKSVSAKEGLHAVLGRSALKQILPDSFWDEHGGEKKTQLRHELEMVESDDARTVDRTAALPHPNQSRSAEANMSKPSASVPSANSAFFVSC